MNAEDESREDRQLQVAERISYLIKGFLEDELTESEHDELDNWISASMKNQKLFEELTDPVNIQKWVDWRAKLDTNAALERFRAKVGLPPGPASPPKRRIWPFWLAAAAIIATIIAGDFWFSRTDPIHTPVVMARVDIQPGGQHATLKINGGAAIILNRPNARKIIKSGSVNITNDSSSLIYASSNMKDDHVKMDELSTPAGGEYQLQLSDGTRAWLNASSTIKYPEQFSDSVRRVEITGEVYFEVSKNVLHPFIVIAGKNEIHVLGTHFNVNHYPDNLETIVTLAEGSVKINGAVILKPGEKGTIRTDGKIITEPADLESALAWKEGLFIFKMTPLDQVMAQISHWYDARIVYRDNNTEHFNARIPRDVPVSKLLHLLETTERVHFKIEDRVITVMN